METVAKKKPRPRRQFTPELPSSLSIFISSSDTSK